MSDSGIRRLASGVWLQSAFTLVELMVVVAIISILVMLLIPNIRTMREKAWSSHCQNNLRQYGIAMNQYMADYSGYFIYPGISGVGGAGDGSALKDADLGDFKGLFDGRAVAGTTVGGAAGDSWDHFLSAYVGANVTLASLSAGEPAVRVCPVVLRDLHAANYFDPGPENSPNPKFKGYRVTRDPITWVDSAAGDFANISTNVYDINSGKLLPDYTSKYLIYFFTTYAINNTPQVYRKNKSAIPQNVVAFIDWNARDGWGANLSSSNYWAFNGTNSAGIAVFQDITRKWTNAWWLTEVGFHHRIGNEYGANYVAMDGHVGWVSSNTISFTNFTTGL